MKRALGVFVISMLIPLAAAGASNGGTVVADPQPAKGRPFPVPEPSDLALFAAGVAGLIIGRRSSRSRRRHD